LRSEETKTLNIKSVNNANKSNKSNLRIYTFKTDIYSRFLYLRPLDVQS